MKASFDQSYIVISGNSGICKNKGTSFWNSFLNPGLFIKRLEGKHSLESTDRRESEIRAPPQLTIAFKLSYYLFIIAKLFKIKDPRNFVQIRPRFI